MKLERCILKVINFSMIVELFWGELISFWSLFLPFMTCLGAYKTCVLLCERSVFDGDRIWL